MYAHTNTLRLPHTENQRPIKYWGQHIIYKKHIHVPLTVVDNKAKKATEMVKKP